MLSPANARRCRDNTAPASILTYMWELDLVWALSAIAAEENSHGRSIDGEYTARYQSRDSHGVAKFDREVPMILVASRPNTSYGQEICALE